MTLHKMKPIEVKVGESEVYSSGTVIGNLDESIHFQIEDLQFEFVFKSIKESPEQKLHIAKQQEKSITLEFWNVDNPIGSGNRIPLQFGNINEASLQLNFRVYALNESSGKLFHYTWLLTKSGGTNNGK